MDNQYDYYRQENQGNTYHYQQSSPTETPKKKKGGWFKKALVILLAVVLCGGFAGAGFQGGRYLMGRVLGEDQKETVDEPADNQADEKGQQGAKQISTVKTTVLSDVSDIVDNTLPSIVSITNMSIQQVQSFFGGISERESESAGTGIILDKNDSEILVVTNNHVVEGSNTLTVTFQDGKSAEALIKGTDSSHDLAVIAVPVENVEADTMSVIKAADIGDSSTLKMGEPTIAIGNALGYGQSVTTGVVSATQRSINGFDGVYIQTSAAINPGNSGGALLNANGEVIGINSAKINDSAVEGIGFAIPITDAYDIIQKLMNRQTRTPVDESEQGYLGIEGYTVRSEYAQMYNMPTGVYIATLVEGGAADKAGLAAGMIISEFDGTAIYSMDELKANLEYYRAGEEIEITVYVPERNGNYTKKNMTITLGSRAE